MEQEDVLNYRVLGEGHPVVFLHGFLESMSMWSRLKLDQLSVQSILIDLPGHGGSEVTDNAEEPSIEFMAQQVRAVLSRIEVAEYDVVGHSMGGYVALELKKTDPNCKKVVLMNSNFWQDTEEKKRDRVRVADIVFRSKDLFILEVIPGLFYRHERKDPIIADLIEEAKKMEPIGIAYAALAMRNRSDRKDVIKSAPEQFMILQGSHDPLIAPEKMKAELEGMHVRLEILHLSGHMAHIEEPERTNELISDFLK